MQGDVPAGRDSFRAWAREPVSKGPEYRRNLLVGHGSYERKLE